MPVAFRSQSSYVTPRATSAAVPAPAGVAADDILLMFVTSNAAGTWTINTPSGWTLLQHDVPGGNYRLAVFWKRAGPSEPSSYTLAGSTGALTYWCAAIAAYSGCSTTAAINASSVTAAVSGAVNTVVTPTVTTTTADTMIVRAVARGGGGTATPPGSYTERIDIQETTWGQNATAADLAQPAAGATGTATFTFSVTSAVAYQASTVALAPAAPAITFVPQIIRVI
jgi:hypothetical protein